METRHTLTLIDTHCHLNHPDFRRDLREALRRAEAAGVERVICVGYDLESSVRAVDIAREVRMIRAVVGVHPHDAETFTPKVEARIAELASDRELVVAVGETGLDYYRNLSPRDTQQEAYRRHIRMASDMELPLVVHCRDAQEDVLAILEEEGVPDRGVVMHFVPADPEFAQKALDLGCLLGVAGPITFQNAQKLRDVVKELPLNRLLVETDAPYLAPHPHRGRRNEPSYLPLVASALAELKGVTPMEAAGATTANARKLFGLQGSG